MMSLPQTVCSTGHEDTHNTTHEEHLKTHVLQGVTSLLLWLNADQVVDALYIQVQRCACAHRLSYIALVALSRLKPPHITMKFVRPLKEHVIYILYSPVFLHRFDGRCSCHSVRRAW